MKEKGKTHEQLMEELEHLRKRVAEFESVDAKHKQSVETLRESERSYRNLALNIPGIVYRVFLREDNRMEFYNDMLLPMSGFKAAELTKGGVCSIDPLIIDEDHPKVLAAVEKAIKKNLPFNIEYRIRHKNGDRRYFSERGRSIPGPDGKPLIISSVIFDITERKRAEEELQHKEHYFRALIEGSIDGIMVLNRDGKIRYESPGCLSLLGYTPEERIGHSALDPIYPEELQAASSLFRQLISGLPARAELRARHKDGSWHVIECTLNNLLDDTAVEGIVVNLRDITERRKTEEKLRESEKKYSTLVEQARDGVHITQDKVITFANKRMAEMSGYAVKELTGISIFDLVPLDFIPEMEKKVRPAHAGRRGL